MRAWILSFKEDVFDLNGRTSSCHSILRIGFHLHDDQLQVAFGTQGVHNWEQGQDPIHRFPFPHSELRKGKPDAVYGVRSLMAQRQHCLLSPEESSQIHAYDTKKAEFMFQKRRFCHEIDASGIEAWDPVSNCSSRSGHVELDNSSKHIPSYH